jgi:DNA-binding response OmpR family regulator
MSDLVLIVDDDAQVRALLAEHAFELGLEVREAADGLAALAQARHFLPALILLDVAMPRMDGKQFLAQAKADPVLKDIPVIVVSGAEQTEVAVECLDFGAEDFVTKPFRSALLRARMRSSLARARFQAAERSYLALLEVQHLELESRVQQRTRELAEAHERLQALDRAKDDFLRLISHELRTPMTGVVGATDALADPTLDGALRGHAVEILRASVDRLYQIVEHALLLTRVRVSGDETSLAPQPLAPIVAAASARVSAAAALRGLTVSAGPMPDWVLCERELLIDALAVLLECAVKFSSDGETIVLAGAREGASVSLRISATGQTIPDEVRGRFFDVLAVHEPLTPGGDLGLGPPVAAEVLRLSGGRVAVEGETRGMSFVVTLQAADAGTAAP